MNDASLQACSPRAGRSSGFFPSSFKAILRSASSLASTVRSAGSSVASTITTAEEDCQREQLQWAGFDRIELGPANIRHVLLLTYLNGFQVWDVENADDVWELVSKRDGPVAFLRVQPQPSIGTSDGGLKAARPLLLVVTSDATNCRSTGIPSGLANGYGAVVGSPPSAGENHFVPTLVKFYSLRSHTYVHTLRFRTAIHAVRCSPRVVAVALVSQLYCFDAATLQSTFSVLTYPSPQPGSSGLSFGYGAVAVGPRWLAYAANQLLISNTGRVSPQHLTPSPGVSPSTSPANSSLVTRYAKESSKQLAAGIVTLGDLGYKALSRYCTEGAGSPVLGSPLHKSSSNCHPDHAGIVIVRDFVTKVVVSQFRAHESPLSALCFDPTGTLLVTASIHGHNINIFRIMPVSNVNGANSSSYDTSASHAHLYKLSRGMTNAVIQDIAFSEDSHWIVVSSCRGTNHLFAISPFGGAVGPHTHGAGPVDRAVGIVTPMPLLPWWSNMGPVRSSQQASSPPPLTVNSSVVSRIKNGNGGWRGTVSGAAAAASGRSCSALGAVAVFFHDGRGRKLDTEVGQDSLKEQLWVLSPSGHLIRYALHLSAGTEGYPDNVSSAMASGTSKETLDLRVVVEPLQKWDVCRRPNQVEREEKMDNSSALDVAHEEAGISSYASGTSMGSCYNSGTLGREEMTPEEMHQWFLSNAEVQMHHFRPPIWAKSQISFHVFSGTAHHGVSGKNDSGGEAEIEKVLTRVVDVRKKDLVPVFDRFRNYQFGEDVRDENILLESTLNSSSLHSGMQYGFISTDVGVLHIQRSSSGSSCGSEGSLYSGPNAGLNGVHHSFQDPSQDLQIQPLPSCLHQPQQNRFHVEKTKLQNTHISGINFMKAKKHVTPAPVGSPPMDIPYLSHPGSHDRAPKVGEKSGVNCLGGLEELQERDKVILPLHGEAGGAKMKIESSRGISFPCGGQIDVGSIPDGYFSSQGGFKHTESAAIRSDNQWDVPTVEGACPHTSQTADLDKTSGRISSGTLNCVEKFDLQDYDAATEDVESTDGNSKSEDFGGEQGEDGWEGAMFPFAEDC